MTDLSTLWTRLRTRHCAVLPAAACGLASAGVLLSADVHFELWVDGFQHDPIFGPLFLTTAIVGLLIGLACTAWPSPISAAAAIVFGLGTLGALLTSASVGLFGLHEVLNLTPQELSIASESLAAVAGAVALVTMLRARPTHPTIGDRASGAAPGQREHSPARSQRSAG